MDVSKRSGRHQATSRAVCDVNDGHGLPSIAADGAIR
jgi:hypothetical protein